MLAVIMNYDDQKDAAEQFAKEVALTRRDQKSDLKIAIDHLYAFKEALSHLHPSILPIIETMLKAEF